MYNEYKIMKYGVACVLIKQSTGQIYLSKRLGTYENGKFACPGGMVDGHEFYIDSIIRELKEETGLELNLSRLYRSITSTHIGGKSDYTVWFYVYLNDDEIPLNVEPDKHGPWKLYTYQETKALPLMVSTAEILCELEKITIIGQKDIINKIYTLHTDEEILELINLHKNGTQLEYQYSCITDKTIWYPFTKEKYDTYGWNSEYKYRIQKQKEIKPKLIPFTRETIPHNALFKRKIELDGAGWSKITILYSDCVKFNDNKYTFEYLMDIALYSLNGGETWNPCGTIINKQ